MQVDKDWGYLKKKKWKHTFHCNMILEAIALIWRNFEKTNISRKVSNNNYLLEWARVNLRRL